MEGFNFGWSLGMLEAVGVLAGSMVERAHLSEGTKRVAPFHNYVLLAGLLGMSSSLSNIALNYIKYPTKVIVACFLMAVMRRSGGREGGGLYEAWIFVWNAHLSERTNRRSPFCN